jgi:hypothetical protein
MSDPAGGIIKQSVQWGSVLDMQRCDSQPVPIASVLHIHAQQKNPNPSAQGP